MTPEEITQAASVPGTYAIHASPEALQAALAKCRGHYQRAVVLGREPLSGAGLRGKAKAWGAGYARSRANLLTRLAGLVREIRGPRGRRVLVVGA